LAGVPKEATILRKPQTVPQVHMNDKLYKCYTCYTCGLRRRYIVCSTWLPACPMATMAPALAETIINKQQGQPNGVA